MIELKVCSKCKVAKPQSEYSPSRWEREYSHCRGCSEEYDRKRRQQPEVKERERECGCEYRQRPEYKVQRREYMREYGQQSEYKGRRRVRDATRRAVARGEIVKPDACRCGATENIEMHHLHYDQPDSYLAVLFLCEQCHEEEHIKLRSAAE
jgi:hypothetical protein